MFSQEYDADVDDDELLCEQEEWESRIYINILKSITSSSNENLLKQIEDRVSSYCYVLAHISYLSNIYLSTSEGMLASKFMASFPKLATLLYMDLSPAFNSV